MPPLLLDRAIQTTNTAGTDTVQLIASATGALALRDEAPDGAKIRYLIVDDPQAATEWETGYGTLTYGSIDTLSRDTVHHSSNGGSKISLQAETTYTVMATVSRDDIQPLAVAVSSNRPLDMLDISTHFSCDTSGGDITLSLPAAAAATGRFWFVVSNTSGTNSVILDPDGNELVNGVSTLAVVPRGALTVFSDGSTWAAVGSAGEVLVNGQCDVVKEGADLKLIPKDGNLLPINGRMEVVPAAGVSLSTAGLSPETFYYLYAGMGSDMEFEASTTASEVDATTGREVKTGDPTRTLVGWAETTAATQWADNEKQRLVRSYFNRKPLVLANAFTTVPETNNSAWVEVDAEIQVRFVAVPEDAILANLNGFAFNDSPAGYVASAIGVDGVSTRYPDSGGAVLGGNGGSVGVSAAISGLSTGPHTLTYAGRNTAGTGNYGSDVIGLLNSLSATIIPGAI